MRDKKEVFFDFLNERTAAVLGESEALAADGRKDESNVLKAKANVYGIFKAIWCASEKMAGNDDFYEDITKRIASITSPWHTSLELGKKREDAARVMVEEAKLSAVSEINAKLADLHE